MGKDRKNTFVEERAFFLLCHDGGRRLWARMEKKIKKLTENGGGFTYTIDESPRNGRGRK